MNEPNIRLIPQRRHKRVVAAPRRVVHRPRYFASAVERDSALGAAWRREAAEAEPWYERYLKPKS